jgi:thiosulfate/3-mercaptopyruvate sulfurtransferase
MPFDTLITASELSSHTGDENWAIIDCRFSLSDPELGHRAYVESHIPGAVYAHLDRDLSGKKIPGKTGRHPLPEINSFVTALSGWGIDSATQVVVYDDASGSMAARLWWMLKWLGHQQAALLDGGWQAWDGFKLPLRSEEEYRPRKRFEPHEIPGFFLATKQIQQIAGNPRYLILDARDAARYRGEVEPIDPVPGHIPGALSAPFEENLAPDGKFLPPEILRRRYEKLIKSVPPENVICYCGSGVTAAHNLLAMAYAGLGMGCLYAGSWSEWITDPTRPVAKSEVGIT